MDKYFVILGGHILNRGIYDRLKLLNYKVITIDWYEKPQYNNDYHFKIDYTNHHEIIHTLEDNKLTQIDGAFASVDLAVNTINEINSHFGLLRNTIGGIQNSADKVSMTNNWERNGLLNRSISFMKSYDEEKFCKMLRFNKIIIKPNKNSSSRGITILNNNESREVYENAINFAIDSSFDDTAIVEEFVTGQEFTVEMLGDNYGNVSVYGVSVKYHTQNTHKNKIAVKLHYNSNVFSDQVYEQIAEMGRECYKSLGLKNCFGHLEIMLKEDGTLSPIEIGARSSGFIASHLADHVSGRNFFKDYIEVLKGARCENVFYKTGNSSMYFFYDFPGGSESHGNGNLTDYLPLGIKSIYHDRDNLAIGTKYDEINSDNERYGYEILVGSCDELTIESVINSEKTFLKNNLK